MPGTSGDDTLNGTSAADTISGGAGNDLISGLGGRDLLQGDAGDDELLGGLGIDTLVGGDGADLLIGGAGNDVYRINLADHDVIFDEEGSGDSVEFSYAGPLSSLTLAQTADDPGSLYLSDSLGGSLQLIGGGESGIESFKINGTTYSYTAFLGLIGGTPLDITGGEDGDLIVGGNAGDLLDGQGGNDSLQGNGGNDTLIGGGGADALSGGSGNDLLVADAGDDTLTGNSGDDTLVGGSGNDVYAYNLGDGLDVIQGSDDWYSYEMDAISFGAGILASNTTIDRDGEDFVFSVDGIAVLRLTGSPDTINPQIREVRFAEGGVIWGRDEIFSRTQTFRGTEGDDAMVGTYTNDTLLGLGGNDTLSGMDSDDYLDGGAGDDILNGGVGTNLLDGGLGNDIYHVAREVGFWRFDEELNVYVAISSDPEVVVHNTINSADAAAGKFDVLRFDYESHEMVYYRDGNDLVFQSSLDNSQTTIANFYAAVNPTKIEQVQFSDGVVIDLQTLVVNEINGTSAANNVVGTSGVDEINGLGGNDTILAGAGADYVQGGDGNDSISGEAGGDYLLGGGGDDYLDGGDGWDRMIGGTGNDTYVINTRNEWYTEENPDGSDNFYAVMRGDGIVELEGEGVDTVITYLDEYQLEQNFENLSLALGSGIISGQGNEAANRLVGNEARNYLYGMEGDDTLDGGGERDHMIGGLGNDTYYVSQSNESDWIDEDEDEGIDTVVAGLSFTLPNHVENLTLVVASDGNKNFSGTGNSLDNYIVGTIGNNALNGLQGNDTLDGGAGKDTMTGSSGDDVYVVDSSLDSVIEVAAQGSDTVRSSISYVLGANLENLVLLGSALSGEGNSSANELIGNAANNTLKGMDGLDTLYGGAGNDDLQGGIGSDIYHYDLGDGQDSITETAGSADVIEFGGGIVAANVTATRVEDNLYLTLDAGNRIAVQNFFGDNASKIEEVHFTEGGVVWDQSTLIGMIETNQPPALALPIIDQAATEDQVFSFSLPPGTFFDPNANDTLGLSATLTSGALLPSWLVFDAATGIFSGTPANGNVGSLNIRVTATDPSGQSVHDDFALDVINVNDAPIVGSTAAGQEASVGTQFSYQLPSNLFSDEDVNDTLTWQIKLFNGNGLPSWLSFNPTTRILSGTPTGADAGSLSLTVRVSDLAGASAAQSFALNVSNIVNQSIAGNSNANTLVGGAGNDTIDGKGGNDNLTGLDGNDSLIGGTGNDTMSGGLGNDIYVVTESGDTVTENAGEGVDTVQSSLSTYTLGSNIENLSLSGSSSISGVGNSLDNRLIGNSGANNLQGLNGNDWLDGAAGNDSLIGGAGNDTYVYGTGDVLTELANGGEDLVLTTGTYTLLDNFENLVSTYEGTSGRQETGNSGNNLIRGSNSAVDTIKGQGGNDILEGAGGDDKISDNAGRNILNGQAGNDSLTGNSGNEVFIGGTGNDTINTDTGADLILFNAGGGTDTVNLSTVQDNTISLGGGIPYQDLVLQRVGNNLVLKTDGAANAEGIVLKDWYASVNNHSVATLQVVAEAMDGFNPNGTNILLDDKVEYFDFSEIVTAFDAANVGGADWVISNALLLSANSGGQDNAAIGGDLAYQYGMHGDLDNVGTLGAQSILSGLGDDPQTYLSATALQQGALLLT